VATKKVEYQICFSFISFFAVFGDAGSEIRDRGWTKTRIRDKHPGSATLGYVIHTLLRLHSRIMLLTLNRQQRSPCPLKGAFPEDSVVAGLKMSERGSRKNTENESSIATVQIDGLVIMKLIKHCHEVSC
jgi:hypothetical protein